MALDVELAEIRDFLAQHAPFDDLPSKVLDELPRDLTIQYFRRGSRLLTKGEDNHSLYVVRSGAVDVIDPQGSLTDRGGVGTTLGSITLVQGNPSTFEAVAIEDTLALVLPAEVFYRLSRHHPGFARFFDEQRASRLAGAVAAQQLSSSGGAILKTHVRDMLRRAPVSVGTAASILAAARTMSDAGVSSLLIMDGDQLAGILTDRDLRNRVVAADIDVNLPVTEVMTPDPVTMSADTLAFEVLLEMTGRSIHHLPILDHGRPLGIVTTTDLMRLEHANPVFLVGDIAKQTTVAGVAAVNARRHSVVEALVAQDASADDIVRVITAIGDAVERRLITLALDDLGQAPVPFCWVTLGSRARHEQALAADQDNALIIDNSAEPEDLEWFGRLAAWVSDALVECGYPKCDGEVMATNPAWRQTLQDWRTDFTAWLTEPTPDAVLRGSIFFDMRPVFGDERLYRKLAKHVRHLAPNSKIFLAHLAKQATFNEPPLGFFRGFVLAKEGDHKDTLDIKRGGIGAVVELARVHALSSGARAVGTRARLDEAVARGILSVEHGTELRDAFEFISYVRIRHQVAQVKTGVAPDNHVAPDALSPADKRLLREAFGIVRSAQQMLTHLYPMQYIS